MRIVAALFLTLSLVLGAAVAQESAQSPETAVLSDMFAGKPLRAEQFSAAVLAQVPLAQLQQIVNQLGAAIGPVQQVRIDAPGRYRVVTATHEMGVQMAMDPDHVIIGILFAAPVDTSASLESLLSQFPTASGFAYLVVKDGAVVAARNETVELAVGSAFKLGVLAALNDEITAGTHKWDEVATLEAGDLSLPTGILQTFPVGAPLTLHTLAALMISQSDNTATNALMRVVGIDPIWQKLETLFPPLTTREFFILKAHPDLLARYAAGGMEARREVVLEADEEKLPDVGAVTAPLQEGAEWYVPLTKLCALMVEVGGLDVMHINPGMAQPSDWRYVAFKGGSEVGVLNLTTRAIGKDGSDWCIAATWNDSKPLDEPSLLAAYSELLSAAARQPK